MKFIINNFWVTGYGGGRTAYVLWFDYLPTFPRLSADFPPTMVRLCCARARDTPARDEVVAQAVGMLDGDVAVTLPVDERVGV